MPEQEVIKYIRDEIAAGYKPDAIKQVLVNQGYNPKDVDRYIQVATSERPVEQLSTGKPKLAIINSLLIIVVIILTCTIGVVSFMGEEPVAEEEMIVEDVPEAEIETKEFAISDFYFTKPLYTLGEEIEFCYSVEGLSKESDMMHPIAGYSILNNHFTEIEGTLTETSNDDMTYTETFSRCEQLDSSELYKGVFGIALLIGDKNTGESIGDVYWLRLTDITKEEIEIYYKEELDEADIELGDYAFVDDNDDLVEDNTYESGNRINLVHEVSGYSKPYLNGVYNVWILQKVRLIDSFDNVIFYNIDNNDIIYETNEKEVDNYITISIPTIDINPGDYRIELTAIDFYNGKNDTKTSEVKLI